jgi:predicted DNA-binding transcriptional regulator AlpA
MRKLPDSTSATLAAATDVGLGPYHVLTKVQTANVLGCSTDTLDRLAARSEGPPRIRISERRIGYPLSGIRQWLSDRQQRAP